MLAKNTGAKVIGIGNLLLMPSDVEKLPDGYDENHPTIQFYLKERFLKLVNQKEEPEEEHTEKVKSVSRMTKDELIALAGELGIEVDLESDNVASLRQKINARQAELG